MDVRYSIRALRKRPAFTIGAILTLALVIGANTAIFSAIYGLVFRRLPYKDPGQLVMLWEANRKTGEEHLPMREGALLIFQQQAQSFQSMANIGPAPSRTSNIPEKLWSTDESVAISEVSPTFFDMIRVAPYLGRTFSAAENVPRNPGAVVLSYSFWRQHFGGGADVLGKMLAVNIQGLKNEYPVVGVMPEGFNFPFPIYPQAPDFWLSVSSASDAQHLGGNNFVVVARLKPGVPLRRAQSEVNTIADRIRASYPKDFKDEYVSVVALQSELIRDAKTVLWVLLAAVGFVLLIGCANVGNLLLVRAVSQEKEMAVRAALGAGRWALVRQMLTEALLLALAGGALGLLLARWSIKIILALLPATLYIPRFEVVALDIRVLGITAGVTLFVAVLFGVLPSLRLSGPDVNEALKSAGSSVSPDRALLRRPGSILLISEVSLALVLLAGAALLTRSLHKLLDANMHFRPERILTLNLDISNAAEFSATQSDVSLYQQFEDRLERMPGVSLVGLSDEFPFIQSPYQQFKADGGGGPISESYQPAEQHILTPSIFDLMGDVIVTGRWFADTDTANSMPVAVINEAMAKRFWPDRSPLGVKVRPYFRSTEQKISYRIVGTIREPRRLGNGAQPGPAVFFAYSQIPSRWTHVVVRTQIDPRILAGPILEAARQVLPGQMIIGEMRTGEEIVSESSARSRFTNLLLSVLSGLALLLAAIGIYGLIGYYTAQRTHEIGIRMALGATHTNVLGLVLRQGMSLVGLGVIFGLGAALILARGMTSLLYEVPPADFLAFAAAASILLVVSLVACWMPARRATHVNPVTALRQE